MGPLVERPRRKSSAASPVGLPSSGTRMRLLGPRTGAPSPGIMTSGAPRPGQHVLRDAATQPLVEAVALMAGHHDEIRLAFAHDIGDRLRRRIIPYHCVSRDTQRCQVLNNRA